jgi:hypothetical protein
MRQIDRPRASLGYDISRSTFFRAEVAVELTQQGIAVFRGPIAQVDDEVFNLLASSLAKGLHPTEVGGIRLDQGSVELMLAHNLAEVVTDRSSAVVSVGRLRRKFL